MLRYVNAACCEDEDHLTNKDEPDFYSGLVEELDEIRRNFRSYLFADNIRRAGVLNPTILMQTMEKEEVWGDREERTWVKGKRRYCRKGE